jgi:hypothetical protein
MSDTTRVAARVRSASILYLVPGLGFGMSVPLVLAYTAGRGDLPMTPFGWRLMGGPFDQVGTDRLNPLGWGLSVALVGVSAVDVTTAIWLREGRRRGGRLALATTPLTLVLGALFVLPFLLAVAPLRAILVMARWRSLR